MFRESLQVLIDLHSEALLWFSSMPAQPSNFVIEHSPLAEGHVGNFSNIFTMFGLLSAILPVKYNHKGRMATAATYLFRVLAMGGVAYMSVDAHSERKTLVVGI
jgi:hypothetical protein